MKSPVEEGAILAIERPDKALWTYYLLCCLAVPPAFPILILPVWFRYHTMRYKFTAEGISMRWGILFRREIILNYARIQDIHLRSNIVERWLGLARILVQTASGSASAEMTLEGLKNFEAVRDFLYSRMRGVHDSHHPSHAPATAPLAPALTPAPPTPAASNSALISALNEIRDELRRVRQELASRSGSKGGDNV